MKIKETLYAPFRKWAEYGPIWIYSDTHFDDSDVKYTVDGDEQVKRINAQVNTGNTANLQDAIQRIYDEQ